MLICFLAPYCLPYRRQIIAPKNLYFLVYLPRGLARPLGHVAGGEGAAINPFD